MDAMKAEGNKLFQEGKFQESIGAYTLAIAQGEAVDYADLHVLRSNRSAAYSRVGSFTEALQDADECVSLQPKWERGHSRRAVALFGLQRAAEAAVAKKDEGNIYFNKKDFTNAIQAFTAGIEMDTHNKILYSNRSGAFSASGQYQAAYRDADAVMSLASDWHKGYTRAATALIGLGQSDRAMDVLNEGLLQCGEEGHAAINSMTTEAKVLGSKHAAQLATLTGDRLVVASTNAPLTEGKNVIERINNRAQGGSPLKVVAFYFSAHWCPPCKQFTPMLVDVYNKVKAAGGGLEVVFVSGDHSDKEMVSYAKGANMPWVAIPYGDSHINLLNQKFKVQGIPALVVVAPNGNVISMDGRSDVMNMRANVMQKWTV